MTTPAFILGSGPSLPVLDLPKLAGQITIGVNRIHLSGFTPSATFFFDSNIWADHGDEIAATDAMIVTRARFQHIAKICLDVKATEDDNLDASKMFISGNTGTAAARWALALGFAPVYLLGMGGGRTDTGLSHFFEGDERPDSDHARMRGELETLLDDWATVENCLSLEECEFGPTMTREDQRGEILGRWENAAHRRKGRR